jgi:hypothetical protein
MNNVDSVMRRRQLLKLVGAGGAIALLPGNLHCAANIPAEPAKADPMRARRALYDLVYPMTDSVNPKARVDFDNDPTASIRGLDEGEWLALIPMQPSQIFAKVKEEAPNQAAWSQRWHNFVCCWKECTDNYTVPNEYPTCPREVDELDFKNGVIKGEGFLVGAAIEVWHEKSTPGIGVPEARVDTDIKVAGTFRCSVLTYPPITQLPTGEYKLYVVNRYWDQATMKYSDDIVYRIPSQPFQP